MRPVLLGVLVGLALQGEAFVLSVLEEAAPQVLGYVPFAIAALCIAITFAILILAPNLEGALADQQIPGDEVGRGSAPSRGMF